VSLSAAARAASSLSLIPTMSTITGINFVRESNLYDKNEYTLDAQIDANSANAARDGVVINHVFREKFSGVDLWLMPKLTELRRLLESTPGKKIIYVYAQDRLVRGEQAEDVFWLLVEFRRYNAEVRFHLNPLDLNTIAGKIQMLIAGHEASGEIAKILDRTWTRGRLKRMKEGKISNAGPQKFGYRRIRETGKAEIVKEEAIVIRRCAELIEQGFGFLTVAFRLRAEGVPSPGKGNWSAMTVRRFFIDPAYKGEGYGWRWSKPKGGQVKPRAKEGWVKYAADAYPPIIEPERWDRIHELIKTNNGIRARQEKHFVLLRGLIFCGVCGKPCYYKQGNGRTPKHIYWYYRCSSLQRAYLKGQTDQCTGKAVTAAVLDREIWAEVVRLLRDPVELEATLRANWPAQDNQAVEDAAVLRRAEKEKAAEVARLASRLRTASDLIAPHIEKEMVAAESERRALEARATELEGRFVANDSREREVAEILDFAKQVAGELEEYSQTAQRRVLDHLGWKFAQDGGRWWRLTSA